MDWRIIIIAAFLVVPGHGQLAGFVSLRVGDSDQETATTNPLLSQATNIAEDLFSNTVKLFNGLPKLFSNGLDNTSDSFLAEFNLGLRKDDCKLSCDQLIAKYGHSVETHEVVTEDGYVLKMFRIPSDGPVVFLQHGLLGSADDYVVAGPDSGIAYLLAKDGYDVWLGNSRGTKHSRHHIQLDPSQAAFWDFSWHEFGYYDLPAMIDYTLNATGKNKLKYIGHSQGATAFWVMASERPEYMIKIVMMIALSPVAFNSHMKSPIVRFLAPTEGLLHSFVNSVGLYELAPDNALMSFFRTIACSGEPEIMCTNLLFLIAGYDVEQLNIRNLPVILSHVPSGASAKQFAHYAQLINSAKFRKFDYGPEENLKRYGSTEPPDYDLKKVTVPVFLMYSDSDWLCDAQDVDKLYRSLPNVIDEYKVKSKNFNHMDFVFAKDVKYLVYEQLRKMLSRY